MKTLNLNKKLLFGFLKLSLSLSSMSAQAQEKPSVNVSGDIVSSYVWRGQKSSDASIQPSLAFTYSNFTLGSWASTNIGGGEYSGYKEVDFYASYSKSGFSSTLTDYWWDGERNKSYFSGTEEGNSGHMLEATVGYQLQTKFPLSVTWNTFFLGKGNKKKDGKNSYSTYVEFAYPFSVQGVNLTISSGFTPWKSVIYGTNGFAFTTVQVKAAKEIKITDSYSLPIYGAVIANPNKDDIHFVLGITIN